MSRSRTLEPAATTRARVDPHPTSARRQAPPYGVAVVDAAARLGGTGSGAAVQLVRPGPLQMAPGDVRARADAGVRGQGSRLPFFDTIQRAFGRHDVGHVQAHTGSEAGAACRSIGARAYATGNAVAFDGTPTLRTAAHEAAHVVQQRAGVHLEGGVGAAGDAYERHADAVADAVVRGAPAESLLDAGAGSSGGGGTSAVQRTLSTQGDGGPTPVTAPALRGLLTEPLPDALDQFLPALAASETDHAFATSGGHVDAAEATRVVTGAKDSMLLDDGLWTFVLPNTAWDDMANAQGPGDTTVVRQDEYWVVSLDLGYLPFMTAPVRAATRNVAVDDRSPTSLMALKTGLGYRKLAGKTGHVAEVGVLGGAVLSVTPEQGGKTQAFKAWFMHEYGAWEPTQKDPRHIGTHDGNDMGVAWHYHVVMPPGSMLGDTEETAIVMELYLGGLFEDTGKAEDEEKAKLAKKTVADQRNKSKEVDAEIAAFETCTTLSAADKRKLAMLKGTPAAKRGKWDDWKKKGWKPYSS